MAAKQDYGGDGSPNGRWVTINGAHVFIKHGQSAEDALKERDESRQNANYSESSKADKRREAVKKYSDTPEKDIAEIGTSSFAYQLSKFADAVRRKLTSENNADLRERYQEYLYDLKNEPKISSDMQNIAKTLGSELIGYDFRIKDGTKERFYQKLAEEPSKRNKDNVRYTIALGDDVSVYNETKKILEEKGYKPIAVKNYWDTNKHKNNPYRGINTNWESPEGTQFEMQFHSRKNHEIKEELHKPYEEQRKYPKGSLEYDKWNQEGLKISNKFVKPIGVDLIKEI